MKSVSRCQITPLAEHQVSFQLDGREVLRWNAGTDYPRPFFFPVVAPSGALITRMGHPGAPDHDHHQSIWFAHNKLLGIDSGETLRERSFVNFSGWLTMMTMMLVGWR